MYMSFLLQEAMQQFAPQYGNTVKSTLLNVLIFSLLTGVGKQERTAVLQVQCQVFFTQDEALTLWFLGCFEKNRSTLAEAQKFVLITL